MIAEANLQAMKGMRAKTRGAVRVTGLVVALVAGFQDIYVSARGEVRLTVERRALTSATCTGH